MKRSLPFVIIAAVAVLTLSIAAAVYRAKTRPAPIPVAKVVGSPTPAEAPEDASSHVRGPHNAPVTLEIYGDFQCPSCALVSQGIDELQKQYEGKMRVLFHEFPLKMHRHAMEAALAAEAAGIQGKFWEMHDALYRNQPVWAEATTVNFLFESYAQQIGLDVARFRVDSRAPDVRARVNADAAAAESRGVKVTPTIFINGAELRAGFTRDKLEATIKTALAPKKSS
jgi:protein-disulfide isomerase